MTQSNKGGKCCSTQHHERGMWILIGFIHLSTNWIDQSCKHDRQQNRVLTLDFGQTYHHFAMSQIALGYVGT